MKKKFQYSETVITAFLTYDKVTDIVTATGLSRKTITKYKSSPDFQEILSQRRLEYVKEAVNKMQGALSECVDTLMNIIRDPETAPQVKVNAIQTVFNQCRDWTQSVSVLERLERIEAQEGDGEL